MSGESSYSSRHSPGPSLSLPAFLRSTSPPRSPHTAPPSIFHSYFAPQHGHASTSRQPHGFRPTRRDLLLVLLTLSFSYLFFAPQLDSIDAVTPTPSGNAGNTGGRYRIADWSRIWRQTTPTCPPSNPRELTFGETVKSYGLSRASLEEGASDVVAESSGSAKAWDGGEEEEEDDELQLEVNHVSTVLLSHSPGWTVIDKLYIYNGSFYVVTEDSASWPELRMMTSTGLPANGDPGNEAAREPKGDEIIYITVAQALKLWGPRVLKMDGMTWLWNDGQFIDHYYHFAAELLLGTWRAYASLDPDITPTGETKLPPPKRLWFLHQNVNEWRDKPRFNNVLTFGLFPSTSMLYPSDFADMKGITTQGLQRAFLLEKAILVDRSAAFRGPYTAPTSRTVAGALHVGSASRWWWEPLRRQMLRYSGVKEDVINRNLEGYGAVDPANLNEQILTGAGGVAAGPGVPDLEPLAPAGGYKPLVTYISRQNSRRHLTPESHADLVKALEDRSKKVGFEFLMVEAEKLSKEEQIAIAARTTIMLGVHGNGLTHLLWMPATPRSAVIEMFFKGGFARDYQWTAHALGIRHFAVQHDQSFTAPNTPRVDYPEGFQGTEITVVGSAVADIIENRLAGRA